MQTENRQKKFAIVGLTESELRHVQMFLSIWRQDEEAQERLASFMCELVDALKRAADSHCARCF